MRLRVDRQSQRTYKISPANRPTQWDRSIEMTVCIAMASGTEIYTLVGHPALTRIFMALQHELGPPALITCGRRKEAATPVDSVAADTLDTLAIKGTRAQKALHSSWFLLFHFILCLFFFAQVIAMQRSMHMVQDNRDLVFRVHSQGSASAWLVPLEQVRILDIHWRWWKAGTKTGSWKMFVNKRAEEPGSCCANQSG